MLIGLRTGLLKSGPYSYKKLLRPLVDTFKFGGVSKPYKISHNFNPFYSSIGVGISGFLEGAYNPAIIFKNNFGFAAFFGVVYVVGKKTLNNIELNKLNFYNLLQIVFACSKMSSNTSRVGTATSSRSPDDSGKLAVEDWATDSCPKS